MKAYDWIVVGAGITGAALAYELSKQGVSVLVVDPESSRNATQLSYGGVPYWAGTTNLMRQLCAEGIEIVRSLSEELDAETQYRDVNLLLTIDADRDPKAIAAPFASMAIPPKLISADEACEMEPLLDRSSLSGALTVKHGHIEAELTARAYIQAMQRSGGNTMIATVKQIYDGAIVTDNETINARNIVVCAGGMTRKLLQDSGISIVQHFSHAELIETPPVSLRLSTLVMPAESQRFGLESIAAHVEQESLWNEPGNEPAPPILDAGAVQFLDGRIRIGQISRVLTDVNAPIDAAKSEAHMREKLRWVLPDVAALPGTYQRCLVAFSRDRLPLVGSIPGHDHLHVFSGFSSPLALVPPLARRFALYCVGKRDRVIDQLSPGRFG